MPDPRESAHFAKIAKITSGDSGPAAEGRALLSAKAFGTVWVPSLSLPFSFTNCSCGASETTEGFVGKAYLRENEATCDPIFRKNVVMGYVSRELAISPPSWESYIHSFWCLMVILIQKNKVGFATG